MSPGGDCRIAPVPGPGAIPGAWPGATGARRRANKNRCPGADAALPGAGAAECLDWRGSWCLLEPELPAIDTTSLRISGLAQRGSMSRASMLTRYGVLDRRV